MPTRPPAVIPDRSRHPWSGHRPAHGVGVRGVWLRAGLRLPLAVSGCHAPDAARSGRFRSLTNLTQPSLHTARVSASVSGSSHPRQSWASTGGRFTAAGIGLLVMLRPGLLQSPFAALDVLAHSVRRGLHRVHRVHRMHRRMVGGAKNTMLDRLTLVGRVISKGKRLMENSSSSYFSIYCHPSPLPNLVGASGGADTREGYMTRGVKNRL